MLNELAIIVVRGVGLGAIFSLIAMSMNVVYGATHILNFAQGNLFVLGGFLAVLLANWVTGVPVWLLLIGVAAILLAVFLVAQGWLTLLPLRHSVEQNSWLITTMAMSIIISATLVLSQGPWVSSAHSPIEPVTLFGMRTPAPYLLCIVLALAWYAGLRWFLSRTLTGLAISALSQDIDAARAAGLKVRRLQLLAFGISGLIVGSAGFVAAPILSLSADTGIRYVLNGFIAAIVGGMGSNLGALIGGPLVGIVAMVATYEIGGEFQALVSLLLLVSVLLVRPEGIFGRAAARRV
ncbi:ABC transporter permease [Pandoraea terrae]|uniref:ABC transporter permease n=1 Tax=Pandoraea terrae TaxID=1537710 RepID=A0A5E4S0F5_9BURK|nr:branched-chain amino acid ABC transporter permease [Pandoraea terrae]VVD68601.1 ABC transporter permease [Pandoraea terrae]